MKKLILIFALLPLQLAYAEEQWSYQLEEKGLFENEIDGHYCEKLSVQGKSLGWVTGLTDVGSEIIFKKCTKSDEPYEGATSKGAIYGGVDQGWYGLKKESNPKIKKLVLSRLDDFSNPSFCRSYIAYWGSGKNNAFFAIVYDFDKRAKLKDQEVGSSNLATDNMYELNPPAWSKDCSSVQFGDRHFKRIIKYQF